MAETSRLLFKILGAAGCRCVLVPPLGGAIVGRAGEAPPVGGGEEQQRRPRVGLA